MNLGIPGFLVALALLAAPVFGAVKGIDREIVVDPRVGSAFITASFLIGTDHPAGSTIIANTGVLRGTLDWSAASGLFTYTPSSDFWTLGTDRFTFTVQQPNGTTQIGVAMLVGRTAGDLDSVVTFDGPVPLGGWSIDQAQGTATVAGGKMTILGTVGGLQLAEANVHREGFSFDGHGLTQGGKIVGGGGSPPPQPPPPGSGFAEDPDYYESFTLLRGVAALNGKPFGLDLRPRPEGDDLRVSKDASDGSPLPGTWVFIGPGPHRYELNWWEAGSGSKVMVWADGRLVIVEDVPGLDVDRVEMGVLSAHPVTSPGLRLDDLALYGWDYMGATLRATIRAVESFEDGVADDLSASGFVHVSSLNVLNGTKDLVVEVVGGQGSTVAYANPGGAVDRSWNGRFRLRVDNLQLPDDAIVTIAEAYSNARASSPLRVEMRKHGTTYQLRTVAKAGSSEVASSWGHFSATGTNVEVQFTTSPSPTFNTGVARLWVNGTLRSETTGLDNYGLTVDGFRIGLMNPAPGILGFCRFDTLQTWSLTD